MNRWYQYEATTPDGRAVAGAVEAKTGVEAETLVLERGVTPCRIYEFDRIRIIKRSMDCFILGWLSFLPFVGWIFAIQAFLCYHKTRLQVGREWNPAGWYLNAGYLLAWFGCFASVVITGLLILRAIAE